MSKFFEDLQKDLIEVIEIEKGERELRNHPCEDLPAATYVIGEKKSDYMKGNRDF